MELFVEDCAMADVENIEINSKTAKKLRLKLMLSLPNVATMMTLLVLFSPAHDQRDWLLNPALCQLSKQATTCKSK